MRAMKNEKGRDLLLPYEDPKSPNIKKISSAKIKALKNFAMKDELALDKKKSEKDIKGIPGRVAARKAKERFKR